MIRVYLGNGATANAALDCRDHEAHAWLVLPDGGLEVIKSGDTVACYACGAWSSVEDHPRPSADTIQKSFSLDISGSDWLVPKDIARELWNELGRALNEANDEVKS